jgi:uracil-DNA glycosylase
MYKRLEDIHRYRKPHLAPKLTGSTRKIEPIETSSANELDQILSSVRACAICRDRPLYGEPLDHLPRPVLQVSNTARICIAGQAPGIRVHRTGRPFDDRSGDRLRQWLGIDSASFYDPSKVAIIPMGFCFPGLSRGGSDLPPRRECAEIWRSKLFAHLPNVQLYLIIGRYAQRWHLGPTAARQGVDRTVQGWRQIYASSPMPRQLPLPHPSWHNNKWLELNPWFENDLLPVLRADVHRLI